MNVLVHYLLQLLDALDPIVLDGVRQSAEDVITVLHTTREDLVYHLILGVVIDQIEHVHSTPRLAETFDTPQSLFEPRWVPRQVNVDEGAKGLKVQAFTGRVGRHDQADLPLLHGFLDVLALDRSEVLTPEQPAFARARIYAYRLSGQRLRQLRTQRVSGVVVLAEDNAAVLQPGLAFGAMFG